MEPFFDLVRQDYADVYADAMMRGTYEEGGACSLCGISTRKRVSPLVIEWDAGSSNIGDFTWPSGLGELVVSDRVKAYFLSHAFTGIGFEAIEMFQKPSLKRPKRRSKQDRVWLPYQGPPLWSLTVTTSYALDVHRSGRSLVTECEVCGRTRVIVHDSTAALIVKLSASPPAHLFRIREVGRVVFGVETVKHAIEEGGFTNIRTKERGFF